jgi:hypothetical protein
MENLLDHMDDTCTKAEAKVFKNQPGRKNRSLKPHS